MAQEQDQNIQINPVKYAQYLEKLLTEKNQRIQDLDKEVIKRRIIAEDYAEQINEYQEELDQYRFEEEAEAKKHQANNAGPVPKKKKKAQPQEVEADIVEEDE